MGALIIFMILCVFCHYDVTATNITSTTSENEPGCSEYGDCMVSLSSDCNNSPCGCDSGSNGNNKSDCDSLNISVLYGDLTEVHKTLERLSEEAERKFRGILISALVFVLCAVSGLIAGCYYCLHIHLSDLKLRKEVITLAKKHGKEARFKRTLKKTALTPAEENCNVVVSGAGLFVV